jgi:alkyl hydroperoxide reductase subunit F
VCGSNDYALRDALYLVERGAQVTLLVPEDGLGVSAPLQARARRTHGLAVHYRATLEAIQGADRVEGVVYVDGASHVRGQLAAAGVAIRVGSKPCTDWLEDVVDLDAGRHILTTADLQTSARHVFAAGDIRSGARPSVATGVGDGAAAAAGAAELLMDLSLGK